MSKTAPFPWKEARAVFTPAPIIMAEGESYDLGYAKGGSEGAERAAELEGLVSEHKEAAKYETARAENNFHAMNRQADKIIAQDKRIAELRDALVVSTAAELSLGERIAELEKKNEGQAAAITRLGERCKRKDQHLYDIARIAERY